MPISAAPTSFAMTMPSPTMAGENDKDSVFVYSATASLDLKKFNTEAPNPCINEFHWGSVEPSVEIRIKSSLGYQAMPISVERAFSGK